MTDPIIKAMKELTGTDVLGCPWRSLSDPFVIRVLGAMPFFESGQLAFAHPQPSHRLVTGIQHYQSVSNRVYCKQLDMERAERERTARRPGLPMRRVVR